MSVSWSILELEKRYTHVNRSEFHQKTIGIETSSLGSPVSGIVRVLRFSPEDLRLTLGSDAFTARTLEYIQKHKRAFWNRLPSRTFWRIDLRNPSTFIFCSNQSLNRFLPLLIKKQNKSVSRSILELDKRYTHANRSEFHQKTIGIETSSLGSPVSGIVRVLRFSPDDLRLTLG